MNKIKVVLEHGGKLTRNNDLDSGFDLHCVGYRVVNKDKTLGEEVWFDENELLTKNRVGVSAGETILILTGVKIELPEPKEITEDDKIIGYEALEAQIRPRSGVSLKDGAIVKFGTIDNPYRGVYGVIYYNHSNTTQILDLGNRIAQVVFAKVFIPTDNAIEVVESFDIKTTREDSGFGDSGK